MKRAFAAVASLLLILGLAACGSDADEEPEPTAEPTAEPTETPEEPEPTEPAGPTIELAFAHDGPASDTKTWQAKVGEPVTFEIEAESAGELHIHSVPDQTIAYPAGRSSHEATFTQPGVVDVEHHDFGHLLVARIQVR